MTLTFEGSQGAKGTGKAPEPAGAGWTWVRWPTALPVPTFDSLTNAASVPMPRPPPDARPLVSRDALMNHGIYSQLVSSLIS